MGIIDFLYKLFNKEPSQQDVIDERQKIKDDIRKKFKTELAFTDLEVDELLDVVKLTEIEIDDIKSSLARVNIDNPNTEQDVAQAVEQINQISRKMYEDIRKKAEIIIQRKKEYLASKKDQS